MLNEVTDQLINQILFERQQANLLIDVVFVDGLVVCFKSDRFCHEDDRIDDSNMA